MKDDVLVVKPKLDVVFKILFTEHPDLLKIFLSEALHMPEEDFAEINILNPELAPETAGEKFARLDIIVRKPDGTKINIELQNSDEDNFKERSVFYCSKLFARDVDAGQNYATIPKTVCINILQFTLFKDEGYVCTVYPTIQESGNIVTDKWEIIYFQTPKLPKNLSDDLGEWLKFFTITTQEEMKQMVSQTRNTGVKQAIHIVEIMNSDDEYRQLAREREETLLNENLILGAMFEKGIGEGLKQGKQQGKLEIINKMLLGGLSPEQISAFTGLPLSEIENL
jgi:predicted transposase/invertase (TIGR01784 family)